eukprot:75065_1
MNTFKDWTGFPDAELLDGFLETMNWKVISAGLLISCTVCFVGTIVSVTVNTAINSILSKKNFGLAAIISYGSATMLSDPTHGPGTPTFGEILNGWLRMVPVVYAVIVSLSVWIQMMKAAGKLVSFIVSGCAIFFLWVAGTLILFRIIFHERLLFSE